jgi:predicted phosphodiesterase
MAHRRDMGRDLRHDRTMRVAVLSDIHANLVALEAVLAESDVRSADRVVLLGDIAVGPVPVESLDLLASLGDRAVWVHGNCERELLAAYDGTGLESPNAGMAIATAALIQPRHRELLDGLPLTVTLDVDGLGLVLFCHATPRRDDDFVLVDSPVPVWRRALGGVEEATVVIGHTHMPFDRLVDRRRVVNAGSVGMSYGTTGAAWALLGPTVQLRTTAFDVEAAAAAVRGSGYADAAEWERQYLRESPSDTDALEVFTGMVDPIDG